VVAVTNDGRYRSFSAGRESRFAMPMPSAAFRLRRLATRAVAAVALLATSQLSACFTVGNSLGGSPIQYQGGPAPSPGGNYNPVSGRTSGGSG
jgi:hypothetical protein